MATTTFESDTPVALDLEDRWAALTELAEELATSADFSLPPRPSGSGGAQVVDLFCGAGGLSAGFEMLGRRTGVSSVVAASDIDPNFRKTYETNIGIRPSNVDLGVVATSDTGRRQFIDDMDLEKREPVILVGGPPCQGFSAHRKRSWSVTDLRNDLVSAYAEIAVAMAPDIVVMENVPELLSGRYWNHFAAFRDRLTESGYTVTAGIHNLASYGVAQERFRAVVLGSRRPVSAPPPVLAPGEYRTVRDEIGHLPSVEPGEISAADPMHQSSRHRADTVDVIRRVPKDGGNRPKGYGPACLDRVDGFRDVYGRLAWDRPSVTITGYSRNPASGRFVHPEQNRGLSLREAALLQGFPTNYVFDGPAGSRYQQVGNAVPSRFAVLLAAHLVRTIKDRMYNPFRPTSLVDPAADSFSSSLVGLKAGVRK